MSGVRRVGLRMLRWAWVLPLVPALALDLANAGSTAEIWASGLTACGLGLVAAVSAVCLTLKLRPVARFSSPLISATMVVATAVLTALAAVAPLLTNVFGFVSLGLMYTIVVLVGVRLAHANNSRELFLAALVGASGVGMLAAVPGDGLLLASLLLTATVISAALGLLVREQRRGVERARRAAVQDERREMAHELHDTVAHEVTGILVLARATRATGGAGALNAAESAALPLIEAAAQRALDQVRELVETLRTVDEDDEDFMPAAGGSERVPAVTGEAQLRDLIDAYSTTTDARVVVEVSSVELSTPGWLALQRVCAEALTNIRRHAADATEVRIRLDETDGGVLLAVADNGSSGTGLGGGTGSGLIGARERVQLLGGSFESGRTPQRWWSVSARLPVSASLQLRKESR